MSETWQEVERCYFVSSESSNITVRAWARYGDSGELINEALVTESDSLTYPVGLDVTTELADPSGNGLVEVRCCCESGGTDPEAVVSTCYLEDRISTPEPVFGFANAVTGRGYWTRYTYNTNQFPAEGDTPGEIDDWHSIVKTDAQGVPYVEGNYTETDALAFTAISETSANGQLTVDHGAIYRPFEYNGAPVAKFEIYDAYTLTNHSDRDELFLGINNGAPSLDRQTLTSVAVSQVGGSVELPASWAGKWSRIAVAHGDLQWASQVSWRARITDDQGNMAQNIALSNFAWNEKTLESLPTSTSTQSMYTRTYDPATGLNTWANSAGDPVQFEDIVQPIQQVACSYLPISYSTSNLGGTFTIESASGGSGGPYEYSFDDGLTWGSSNTYTIGDTSDGTEPDILEIIPRVRDSESFISNRENGGVFLGDPVDSSGTALRVQDIDSNNQPESTVSNNPDDPGGWITYFGQRLEYFDTLTAADNWTDNSTTGVVLDAGGWLTFNNTSTGVGGIEGDVCFPVDDIVPNGEFGAVSFTTQNLFYGTANTNIEITWEVVDALTDTVLSTYLARDNDNDPLGQADVVWNENTNQTFQNSMTFIGTGNPVCLRVRDESLDPGNDAGGHYWRMTDVGLYEGFVTNTSSHFWRINAYIEASGITSPQSQPAILQRAPDDVSLADEVRIAGNIVISGTFTEDVHGFEIQYRLDGGPWITTITQNGQFNAAGEMYYTPNFRSDPINTSNADEIQVRLTTWGDGTAATDLRIYDLSIEETIA